MQGIQSIIPLILVFGIMYFLLIRPQQKKLKEHQQMVAALRRGDQVVTQAGLIGKVTKVKDDNEVEVEIGDNRRRLRVLVARPLSLLADFYPALAHRLNTMQGRPLRR